jgi:hypothetical protein
MQSLNSLLKRIQHDNTAFGFVLGEDFMWSPSSRTIAYQSPQSPDDIWTLLHELGHAQLGHSSYEHDVELVRYEVAAWERAKELAKQYGIAIDETHIEDYLDTYRFWLHERSTCPTCGHNGLQQTKNTYSCFNCKCLWRVNEARVCRLKRTKLLSRDHSA